ncbi:hypothetical protein HDV00_002452 [Rhizophlyctis rosea]|nr:hypothetical protein HDV00_002452 [Rhizophlyctis rosea]
MELEGIDSEGYGIVRIVNGWLKRDGPVRQKVRLDEVFEERVDRKLEAMFIGWFSEVEKEMQW